MIFLVGDMNSSMLERLGNDRDKLLKCFIYENSLLHSQDGTCTYIHSKDSSSSEIDYIFYSEDGANLVDKVDVLSDHMNVSDHLPVVAELKIKKSIVNVENRTIDIKPKWDKCDHRKYKDIISRDIGRFPDDVRTEFEFLCALGHMTSVLKRAVVGSVPGYRDKIKQNIEFGMIGLKVQ